MNAISPTMLVPSTGEEPPSPASLADYGLSHDAGPDSGPDSEPEASDYGDDPGPCNRCGRSLNQHHRIDTPDGPDYFCLDDLPISAPEIEIRGAASPIAPTVNGFEPLASMTPGKALTEYLGARRYLDLNSDGDGTLEYFRKLSYRLAILHRCGLLERKQLPDVAEQLSRAAEAAGLARAFDGETDHIQAVIAEEFERAKIDPLPGSGPGIIRPATPPAPKLIKATPFAVRDPATLPVRDILYGCHLTRGFVAGLVGIGGSGKSTVAMSETFAQVSGKPLLGIAVRRPLRCWSINLEDPRDEIERRAQATCLHYGLTEQDIGGRLFLDSGRDQPVVVAHTLAGGTKIIEPVVENIIDEIKARQIDVLRIDPFVSSHEVPENDNGSIDMVIKKAWSAVAERAGCAVELVHHLRKIGDNEPTVDDARGAGAFMAGCRAVRIVAGMTKAEAERAGIENPYRYFRVFAGKLNMAPREDKSDWLFLESVDLGNQTADRPSDHVQVAVPWSWPNALDGLHTRDLFAVQRHVSEGQWRKSATSPEWVGKAVAAVLDLDVEDAPVQNRIKSLLKTWIETGALKVVKKLDEHRKEREFVEVGQWAAN